MFLCCVYARSLHAVLSCNESRTAPCSITLRNSCTLDVCKKKRDLDDPNNTTSVLSCTTSASLMHIFTVTRVYICARRSQKVGRVYTLYLWIWFMRPRLTSATCLPVLQLIRLASSLPLFLRGTVEPFPAMQILSPVCHYCDSSTFAFSHILVALFPSLLPLFARLFIKAWRIAWWTM